ncbi:MAG TPA: hypothetical protein VM912_18800 [Terriglobales bacterium]|nr:hypothetical protein [Terriglobales bacterium]
MAQKMLTCTCGNTDLEKIGVRLHLAQNGNGKSLPLMALMCRGAGCGRVTFRPDENARDTSSEEVSITTAAPAPSTSARICALFERVYTERLVYKAIAERDPACSQLFEALKTNPDICGSIHETFVRANERIGNGEDLLVVLESLPSINK